MENINANKTNLNKIIRWSTSRFCEWRKHEVIEDILDKIKIGRDVRYEYRTGSYAESSHLSGWGYLLEIKNNKITLTEVIGLKEKKYELIVRK